MNIEEKNNLITEKEIYTFTGIVHPARADVTLPKERLTIKGIFPDNNSITGEFEFSCVKSLITATFLTDSIIENINYLRNIIKSAVSLRVHYLGFTLGCGYDVEIDRVLYPNGEVIVFGVDFPALQEKFKNKNLHELGVRNMAFKHASPYIGLILSDFNTALVDPISLPFYCYRCIEAIMQSFKVDCTKSEAWKLMREKLHIERETINSIKDHGDLIRHAIRSSRTEQQNVEIVTKTWEIIFKFLQFLKNKEKH